MCSNDVLMWKYFHEKILEKHFRPYRFPSPYFLNLIRLFPYVSSFIGPTVMFLKSLLTLQFTHHVLCFIYRAYRFVGIQVKCLAFSLYFMCGIKEVLSVYNIFAWIIFYEGVHYIVSYHLVFNVEPHFNKFVFFLY